MCGFSTAFRAGVRISKIQHRYVVRTGQLMITWRGDYDGIGVLYKWKENRGVNYFFFFVLLAFGCK